MNRWVLLWLLLTALAINSFWLNIAFLDRRGWAGYQLVSAYFNAVLAVVSWKDRNERL